MLFGKPKLDADVAYVALFTIAANMARKLNITPHEFNSMINDIEGASEYLKELMFNQEQRKENNG